MANKKRIIAGLTCLVILLSFLFSVSYIVAEADHNCTGENCPICHTIKVCIQAIQTAGTAIAVVAVAFAAVFIPIASPAVQDGCRTLHTLVSLKVKLSD